MESFTIIFMLKMVVEARITNINYQDKNRLKNCIIRPVFYYFYLESYNYISRNNFKNSTLIMIRYFHRSIDP